MKIKKMYRVLYLISLLLICTGVQSQSANTITEDEFSFTFSDSIFRTDLKANTGYIRALNQLLSKPSFLKSKDYYDKIAWLFSYTGRYEKAIEIEDKIFPSKKPYTPISINDYEIVNAVSEISRIAVKHRVIMINEEHRMPRHRILTYQLLESLFNQNYRYLAVETLAYNNSLNENGKPLMSSGFYSQEPIFADLLRKAFSIGFKLIPYEITDNQRPENYTRLHPLEKMTVRESAQANNIIENILKKDTSAKIIVHAGRGHVAKIYDTSTVGNNKFITGMMAGIFRKVSEIDPFTVDQLKDAEHSDTIYESSIFQEIKKISNAYSYNMLKDKKAPNEYFSDNSKYYNARIIPIPAKWVEGRPDWLWNLDKRKPLRINIKKLRPETGIFFLAQAIYINEDPLLSIPADQYAYEASDHQVTLLLKKGDYLIRILDNNGNIKKQWTQQIK